MGKAAARKRELREAPPLPARFDFGPQFLVQSTAEVTVDIWFCEECGWPWPLAGPPPEGAECDSCGGELVRDSGQ
jgi:hypothetical protein